MAHNGYHNLCMHTHALNLKQQHKLAKLMAPSRFVNSAAQFIDADKENASDPITQQMGVTLNQYIGK